MSKRASLQARLVGGEGIKMSLLSDGVSPCLVFLTAIYVCNDCALYTYC